MNILWIYFACKRQLSRPKPTIASESIALAREASKEKVDPPQYCHFNDMMIVDITLFDIDFVLC